MVVCKGQLGPVECVIFKLSVNLVIRQTDLGEDACRRLQIGIALLLDALFQALRVAEAIGLNHLFGRGKDGVHAVEEGVGTIYALQLHAQRIYGMEAELHLQVHAIYIENRAVTLVGLDIDALEDVVDK